FGKTGGATIRKMRGVSGAFAKFWSGLMRPLPVGPPSARDDSPTRPIRIVVPVGAGAGIDTAARITAAAAEPILGGKFIVENKPGASQRLGASLVARAVPDGYTILFTSPAPIVVAQFFPPQLDFDPEHDFRPL